MVSVVSYWLYRLLVTLQPQMELTTNINHRQLCLQKIKGKRYSYRTLYRLKAYLYNVPVQHKALLVQCGGGGGVISSLTTGLYVVGPSALPLFLLSTTRGRQTHQGKVTWGKDVLYS